MHPLSRLLLAAFFALAPVQTSADPAKEASGLFAQWKAAFNANDNVAVAKLYAPDATLLGTRSSTLTVGREAITKYFTIVVGTGNEVDFVEYQLMVINPTTVLAVGFNDFLRNREGKLVPEPARFTMVLVKQGNDWLIAHHHSSLRPSPPQ